jgi:hypothetical protein
VSFWDKMGAAAQWTWDTGATVGGAVSAANHWVEDIPIVGGVVTAGEKAVTGPFGLISDVDQQAISYVSARPLSTAIQFLDDSNDSGFGAFGNIRRDWNRSEKIGPGQAAVIAFNRNMHNHRPGEGTFDTDAETQAARDYYFQTNWAAKASSGTMDALVDTFLDPTIYGGKVAKATMLARVTFKNKQEVSRVMDLANGIADMGQASRRSRRLAEDVNDVISNKTSGSVQQIMANPLFKKASNGATFAYLMHQANQITDVVARNQAKRHVFGTMLGDETSLNALRENYGDLAIELNNLNSIPIPTKAMGKWEWQTFGEPVWQEYNVPGQQAEEVTARIAEIQAQMDRLSRVSSAEGGHGFGSVNRVRGGLAERANANLQQSYILGGWGWRPIRVIGASLQNRLPGYISAKDASQGYLDLSNYLKQAIWLDRETSDGLLATYASAPTTGDRLNVLLSAEKRVNESLAKKYGFSPAHAEQVRVAGRGRSEAIQRVLRSRMYSADEEAGLVSVLDPEVGEHVVVPRPLLQSQLEDAIPLADPRQLEKAYRLASHSTYLDKLPLLGEQTANLIYGPVKDALSSVLYGLTSAWKMVTLFNPGYPLRVQADTQLRQAIYMGAYQYGANFVHNARVWRSFYRDADRSFLKDVFKGDTSAVMEDYLKRMGLPEAHVDEVIRRVAAQGGTMADLLSESANAMYQSAVGSGEWAAIKPTSKDWLVAYKRAVNRQLANSPTAMAVVRGLYGEKLRAFVRNHPEARKEWANLKAGQLDDMDGWLGRVEAHVNSLLPTAEQRAHLAGKGNLTSDWRGRAIGDEKVREWYGDGTGPTVHGESFNPVNKDTAGYRTMERLANFRNGFYKTVGDAPETVIGRMPVYRFAYERKLKEILGAFKTSEAKTLNLDMARRTADRHARAEVQNLLFDTTRTSNLAGSFRTISPFFSAWEDTMKKYSKLFYDKPWAAVRVAEAWTSPERAGLLYDEYNNRIGEDGNFYDSKTGRKLDPKTDLVGKRRLVTLPTNWLPKPMKDGLAALGIDPNNAHIDKNSANSIFQGEPYFLPGMGPLVQYPANELVKHGLEGYEDTALVRYFLPFGTTDGTGISGFAESQMPPSVRRFYEAFTDSSTYNENVKNILAYQTALYQQGKAPRPDVEDIMRKARLQSVIMAVTNTALPVKVKADAEGQFYIDQAKIYRKKYAQDPKLRAQYIAQLGNEAGVKKFQEDYPSWDQKFAKDFPGWFAMTASLTANDTGVNASIKAERTAKKLAPYISAHPEWGWAIVGPDNQYQIDDPNAEFSQAANNALRDMGFRGGRNTPTDAVDQALVNQGWTEYQTAATWVNQKLASMGLTDIDDPRAKVVKKAFQDYKKDLGDKNNAWGADYASFDSGKSLNFLSDMYGVYADMTTKKSPVAEEPQWRSFAAYVAGRAVIRQAIAASGHTLEWRGNSQLKTRWQGFVQDLVADNIGFEQMYNRVLVHDDLKNDLNQGAPTGVSGG